MAPLVPTTWPAMLLCDRCPTCVEMRGVHPSKDLTGSFLTHHKQGSFQPRLLPLPSPPPATSFGSGSPSPQMATAEGNPVPLRALHGIQGGPRKTHPSHHTKGWQQTPAPLPAAPRVLPACSGSGRGPVLPFCNVLPDLLQPPASALVLGTCFCWGSWPLHFGSQTCKRSKGKGPLKPSKTGGRPDPEPHALRPETVNPSLILACRLP